jgi:hypothetical protein
MTRRRPSHRTFQRDEPDKWLATRGEGWLVIAMVAMLVGAVVAMWML